MTAAIAGPLLAVFVSCYDGDTCRVDAHVWPDLIVHAQVRIRGIDAPEIYGKCDAEKALARAARQFISDVLESASQIHLLDIEHDKYAGRVVADMQVDGRSIAPLMIDSGFARSYDGGARQGWCD